MDSLDFSQFQPSQQQRSMRLPPNIISPSSLSSQSSNEMPFILSSPCPIPNFANSERFTPSTTTSAPKTQTRKPRVRKLPEPDSSTGINNVAAQQGVRKPRARKDCSQGVDNSIVQQQQPIVRKRAQRKIKQTDKELSTKEACEMQRLAAEQHQLNRVQETVTHYGPTGLKVIETTTMRHEEKTSKQEMWRVEWSRERVERERMFTMIENYSQEECKQKSHGFHYYDRKLRRELMLFKQKVKSYLDDDMSRAWTDSNFVLRFLFGLPNVWEQEAQLESGEVPWLACLWSMGDMLALCKDKSWVVQFCAHDWNCDFYVNKRSPDQLFCINQRMMCGFVTGQLLAHTMPDLRALMRQSVRDEVNKCHFPMFSEYIIDNLGPPVLLLSYDFNFVDIDIPQRNARDCKPANTCCVLGLEADAAYEATNPNKHVFCDATFVRLLEHTTIRDKSMQVARSVACDVEPKQPHERKQKTFEDALESM